jgi:hypothetical protein
MCLFLSVTTTHLIKGVYPRVGRSVTLLQAVVPVGSNRCPVGRSRVLDSSATSASRRQGTTLEARSRRVEWDPLGAPHRSPLEGSVQALSALPDVPPPLSAVGEVGHAGRTPSRARHRSQGEGRHGPERVLHRRDLRGGEKRGTGLADQAGQRHGDHGSGRPRWSSSRHTYRKCFAP